MRAVMFATSCPALPIPWDRPETTPPTRLHDVVGTVADNSPRPGLNNTPIHFNHPGNYWYRNAVMTMLTYTPRILGYVQRWHMLLKYPSHQYTDHISQALDNLAQAYHSAGPTRVADTEAAMYDLWQLFPVAPSSVSPFEAVLPEPAEAEQEDPSLLLLLMLSEIEIQLGNSWIPDGEDNTQDIFQAMLKTSFTARVRCPGTQDAPCSNPNQKQRRQLENTLIFNVRIPTGTDLTLRDCVADNMRDRDQGWCGDCIAQMRHINPDTKDRGRS